jgi:hypothetical protein
MVDWGEKEIIYLKKLSSTCERLAQRFNTIQASTKSYQNRIKIPVIVLSSIAGVASFGSNGFDGSQMGVSIAVGAVNIAIAIANSIDSLLGLTEIIQKATKASAEFVKLKEHIDFELSLPIDKRSSSADIFMRESYNEYMSILESSPNVLKNLRWISMGEMDKARLEIQSIGSESGVSCFGFGKKEKELPAFSPQPSVFKEVV